MYIQVVVVAFITYETVPISAQHLPTSAHVPTESSAVTGQLPDPERVSDPWLSLLSAQEPVQHVP